jgi:hypothetical protein
MKTHPIPQQKYIKKLMEKREIQYISPPTAVKLSAADFKPNTLFEMEFRLNPPSTGDKPISVWLHVHTATEQKAEELGKLWVQQITAMHLKPDAHRFRGKFWILAQRAMGNWDARVIRTEATLQLLFAALDWVSKNSRPLGASDLNHGMSLTP